MARQLEFWPFRSRLPACLMLNILNLIDDANCFAAVRALRWPGGVRCVHCDSPAVSKQGRDTTQPSGRSTAAATVGAGSMT